MGIVINQSIKSSIIAYLGVAIGYVNVLWLFPYFLEADQVGLFRAIQSAAYLLATFGQFGSSSTLIKYFPEYKEKPGYLTTILLGGFLGFLLLTVTTFAFEDQIVSYFSKNSPLFIEYFGLTLMVSFLIINFQILEAYSRSFLKIVIPNFLRDIGLRILTTIALVAYGFELISFHSAVLSLAIIYAIVLLSLGIYLKQNIGSLFHFDFGFIKPAVLKKLTNYAAYALLGASGTQIILQIDSIMITGAIGLNATGIYTIAFFIGTVIEMPQRPISQISMPLFSQSFEKNDHQAALKLYRQTAINQMIIGALIFVGIVVNLDSIYALIPNNEDYLNGMNVAIIIGLAKLIDMLFGANGPIIAMSKYYRFSVISVGCLAIGVIALNLWLIPLYGIEGAAISSLIAGLFFNLTKFFFIKLKLDLQPFGLGTLKVLVLVIMAFGINYFIPSMPLFLDMLIRSIIVFTIIIGGAYWSKASEEVNALIEKYWGKIFTK